MQAMSLTGWSPRIPSHPLTVSAEGNRLLVIPGDNIVGVVEVTVDGSLRNTSGDKLGERSRGASTSLPLSRDIRSAGKGVIMPSSGSLIFPFMAANLSAVDLTIIKIFENNLPYFLQQNSMGEANDYEQHQTVRTAGIPRPHRPHQRRRLRPE